MRGQRHAGETIILLYLKKVGYLSAVAAGSWERKHLANGNRGETGTSRSCISGAMQSQWFVLVICNVVPRHCAALLHIMVDVSGWECKVCDQPRLWDFLQHLFVYL